MSFSPSLTFMRLQELKIWQGSYENLLQNSKNSTHASDFESIEGIAALDTSGSSAFSPEKRQADVKNWDKKEISPAKPFEQLLEEKLAEDRPMKMTDKPKRPFLRKGQGLARFRMNSAPPIGRRNKSNLLQRNLIIPDNSKRNSEEELKNKTAAAKKRGILKNANTLYYQDIDLSPLTVPDFVKPRGTWKQVLESSENNEQTNQKVDVNNEKENNGYDKSSTEDNHVGKESSLLLDDDASTVGKDSNKSFETPKNSSQNQEIYNAAFNKHILEKINEYALNHILPQQDICVNMSNDIPHNISQISTPVFPRDPGERTLYEERMEKELRIFETLERKVENSSFCSTNTSIANLLASTPQKVYSNRGENDNDRGKGEDTKASSDILDNIHFTTDRHETVQMQLQEVALKTDLLQNFLLKLRMMDHQNQKRMDSYSSDRKSDKSSTTASLSDEETRWSTRSPSPISPYTELDTTCQNDSWKKIDVAVNTSFDSRLNETDKEDNCKECEELGRKLSKTKNDLSEAHSENAKLQSQLKDCEKRYEKSRREMEKMEKKHEEAVETVKKELETERKKFLKEKSYFETYVKESQNRPTKKERGEITQLKQELADAKELIKLKETKHGATQARLRTQIKQQEKDVAELRITVEKLQRENAKLNANQKFMRRPTEVKMLHEINKNLSKLTEETFKKQLNKSGHGDFEENGEKNRKDSDKVNAKEKENEDIKDSLKDPPKIPMLSNIRKDGLKNDSHALDLTNSDNLSIEKQYESVFGPIQSPRNSTSSTNLEKTERTLPDGAIEISYGNGNLKTISPDGQLIRMRYFNGDVKETNLRDKVIRYHYSVENSWHIQYPDGTEVMEYADGQKSKKFNDGKTEVHYSDGSVRVINTDGTEEQIFLDGRKTIKNTQGEQIILLPNGQKEIHTKDFKRREYPDGTIRTLHKDGTVETIYSNGRVRLKDANGILIMDTHQEILT